MSNPIHTVQIGLSPSGGLSVGLPGPSGTTRWIDLRHTASVDPTDTITMILEGLAYQQSGIGLQGAPTHQQLSHWEKHHMFPDPKCVFCQAEQRIGRGPAAGTAHKSSHTNDRRYQARDLGSGVTVRRIPVGATAKKERERAARLRGGTIAKKAEDLGF